jgi:hypothetical protein
MSYIPLLLLFPALPFSLIIYSNQSIYSVLKKFPGLSFGGSPTIQNFQVVLILPAKYFSSHNKTFLK